MHSKNIRPPIPLMFFSARLVGSRNVMKNGQYAITQLFNIVISLCRIRLDGASQGITHKAITFGRCATLNCRLTRRPPGANKFHADNILCFYVSRKFETLVPPFGSRHGHRFAATHDCRCHTGHRKGNRRHGPRNGAGQYHLRLR